MQNAFYFFISVWHSEKKPEHFIDRIFIDRTATFKFASTNIQNYREYEKKNVFMNFQ